MTINSLILGAGAILIVVTIIAATIALSRPLREYRKESLSLWEVNIGYNQANVRRGREISNRILRQTQGVGFPSYEAYNAYFSAAPGLSEEKQYLHDLISYYHQLGLLIWKGEIDAESVFLLIGPGFIDRWKVMRSFGSFYASDASDVSDRDIDYGGIYLFYDLYKKWSQSPAPLKLAIRSAYVRATKEVS